MSFAEVVERGMSLETLLTGSASLPLGGARFDVHFRGALHARAADSFVAFGSSLAADPLPVGGPSSEGVFRRAKDRSVAKPIDTVTQLTAALNGGDLEAALRLYEADAVLVAQPGQLARGSEELRAALRRFIDLKPRLTAQAQSVIESGDIALYMGRWTLQGSDPDGREVSMGGESADILRRQADGRWLIAIDNPWGAQILDER